MTLRGRLGKLEAQARAEAGGPELTVYRADSGRGVWVDDSTGTERPMSEEERLTAQEASGRAVLFLGAGGYSKVIYGIDPEEL